MKKLKEEICQHIWLDSLFGEVYCRDCGDYRELRPREILYRRIMTREGYAYEPVN